MKSSVRILHWDFFWMCVSASILIGFFKPTLAGVWDWFMVMLPMLLVLLVYVIGLVMENNTTEYPYEENM